MAVSRNIVAVDLGAESGRVSLCRWDGSRGRIGQVYRFSNEARRDGAHLVWDVEGIWREVLRGLAVAADQAGGRIDSVGVDGWGVDYALVGADGARIGPCFCYRDPRNPPQMERAFSLVPKERIYRITGIQFIPINTLYQLLAHIEESPDTWERARVFLNLPEYFLYRLSGETVAELTNASTTQMLDVSSRAWSQELARAFGLGLEKFPPLVEPGTILGKLRPEIETELGLKGTRVVAPACHDTASAVAAIPFAHDRLAFISSGTWSLVGTSLARPVTSPEAERLNFTNEGGVGRTTRFLKNIIGLWLLQECLREWNAETERWSAALVAERCAGRTPDGPWFEVESGDFLVPGDMVARINAALREKGEREEHEPVELAAIIFRSLARSYARVVAETARVTGKTLERICIIGGGVKNETLNALTAQFAGIEVLHGASESSSIGNAAVQIAALEHERTLERIQEISAEIR